MKLIVDIPDEMYQTVKNDNWCGNHIIGKAIRNGKPLPEHHGRLIDVDDLYENTEICHSDEDGYACVRWKEINDAPTIIEGSESE